MRLLLFLQMDANLLGENQQKLATLETEHFHYFNILQFQVNEPLLKFSPQALQSFVIQNSKTVLETGDFNFFFHNQLDSPILATPFSYSGSSVQQHSKCAWQKKEGTSYILEKIIM